MNKHVFINDSMNMGLMEALDKASELNLKVIAAVVSPRDSRSSLDVWLFKEPKVEHYSAMDALKAVIEHTVIVVEEDLINIKTLSEIEKIAEVLV